MDFRLIPGSAESFANGFEPSVENPDDPNGRIFNYPAFWRLFFYAGVTQEDPIFTMNKPVSRYLDLLDSQRESALTALEGISDSQLWQRPAPKEWSIGEILDHNYLLIASFYPVLKRIWSLAGWYGRLRRGRPYETEIEDLYRDSKFPQWVGFLWTPRHNKRKPASFEQLKSKLRTLPADICRF